MNTQTTNENPLGTQPVKKLLMQFAIPSIVAMLVSSLYNIVDQFFIGRHRQPDAGRRQRPALL